MGRFQAAVDELGLRTPSPLTPLKDPRLEEYGVSVGLKRDDLIHPDLPGNKWRKLKYNLEDAIDSGASTLLTFGGAYSNHVRAVAAAAEYFGLGSVGVIRGERHDPLNEVLAFAESRGMQLDYMDRGTYRRKDDPSVLAGLRDRYGEFFLIPEGGSNTRALPGCVELVGEIAVPFDVICCPCGTGGTLAGIAAGLAPEQQALGFAVLKGAEFLNDDVRGLQEAAYGQVGGNWRIEQAFHFGGYAKTKPELTAFIDQFEQDHGLRLDWVYVAKMMYGIWDLVERGRFKSGTRIVAVVTG